jgi:hypothetical protein
MVGQLTNLLHNTAMSWERRRNGRARYYYRARRIGVKVVKEYVGAGKAGEEAARQDAQKREERLWRRTEERTRRREYEVLEAVVTDMSHQGAGMVEACLLATGYYRHHREWRHRRGTKKEER